MTFPHHNHRLDMILTVAEALNPNTPNLDMTLAVAEALSPNKPNLDMTLAVAEALIPNTPKPILFHPKVTLEVLNPPKGGWQPGASATLKVTAAMDATVALLAVDKAVYFLNDKDVLTRDKVGSMAKVLPNIYAICHLLKKGGGYRATAL